MSIKGVIFDIGGVLLNLGEWRYRQEVAEALGLERLPELYNEQMGPLQRGEIDEAALFSEMAGRPVDPDRFAPIFRQHFTPNEGMLTFAAELRGLGLKTAVLSNTQASHVRVLRQMNFLNGFEPIVMSCDAGCRKPEARAFEYVLERLALAPEEVAFLDDIPAYLEGARALGIHAVQHTGDLGATREQILALLSEA